MADDPKITQRYRELGAEEPPRHLDDAILAASRRALAGKKRQWYVPLAAAAVIVLAVAVTVHVERERPDEEVALSQPAPPAPTEQKAFMEAPEARARRDAPAAAAPAAPPPRREEARRRAQEAAVADRQASERAKAEAESSVAARSSAGAVAARPTPAPQAAQALAKLGQHSPEQWLLAIDDLKRQGKHEEAEKQLAEFRKRYPDYLIPEAIAEKFERR
jgi:hypothetical protein